VAQFIAVTELELARARADPAYRRQLLSATLEQLLAELSRHQRRGGPAQQVAQQLREGSLLAVKLADLISRLDHQPRDEAPFRVR
jgi:hypothetical protein